MNMKKYFLSFLSLCIVVFSVAQGTETFTNTGSSSSTYRTINWTGDNGLAWSATDSRNDLLINSKALTVRNGSIICNSIPNGIGSISFQNKQEFSGSGGAIEVKVNGNIVGTINPTTTIQTSTINNINVVGTFNLELKQTTSGLRISIDDVVWTGYSGVACVTPTAQPTALTFGTITNNSIAASFTAASPAANEYLVVRSTSSTLSSNPVDGQTYDVPDLLGGGTVISKSSTVSFTSSGLTAGTTYYFFIFSLNSACTGGPLYLTTAPLTGNTSTTSPAACVAPTAAATSLVLTSTNTTASGNFTAASSADGYLVCVSSNASLGFTPSNNVTYSVGQSVGNGTVVSFSSNNNFLATGLTANSTYYFTVFSANQFNCIGGPLYYTSNTLTGSTVTSNSSTGEPAGYYTTATGNCATLKTNLKNIISANYNQQTYGALMTQYAISDIKPREVGSGSTNVIWDIYSDNPTGVDPYNFTPVTQQCGNYSGEGNCYNREHSFPASWFNDAYPMYSDYIQVLPTDGWVNNKRGNYKFGEVGTATWTSLNGSKLGSSSFAGVSGTVFEPINAYKGDLARIYLYMVTRYESNVSSWAGLSTEGATTLQANTYPSVNVSYLQMMLNWHFNDPVSQKEIDRNNAAYTFQGNRNPFIDHPEYVGQIWNNTCAGLSALPVDLISFSGKLINNKIELKWIAENEVNLNQFEIERSFNGTSFLKIGEIKALQQRNYLFTDNADEIRGRRVYYRLKKVDNDGKFSYSQIVTLHIPFNTKFTISPNPANNYIQLQLNQHVVGKVTVLITDVMGKMVLQENKNINNSSVKLNTHSLSNGTYLVTLLYNGERFVQKVLISK
jgi:endonuclease I